MAEDRKMNDFAQVTDAEYIYAETADRSQVKIRKSDLLNALFQDRGAIKVNTDFNTIVTTGIYQYFIEVGSVLNGPGFNRMILLCFKTSGHVAQIAVSIGPDYSGIKYRGSWNSGGDWLKWTSINLT